MYRAIALLLLTAAALGGGAAWVARHRSPMVMTPYFRFVDLELRGKRAAEAGGVIVQPIHADRGTTDLPMATLLNDSRYVLRAPTHTTVAYTESAIVGADGSVSFFPTLPAELRDADRLLLVPQLRTGTAWKKMPSFEAVPTTIDGERKVQLRFATGEAPNTTVGAHLEGFAVPKARPRPYRTPVVRIPSGAYLDFAIGIPRAVWAQGAVEFEVLACAPRGCDLLFNETLDPSTEAGHGWQDRRVSLESVAGSDRHFRFTTRLQNADPRAFSFPLWANPSVYAPQHESQAVNIILLSIDTLRADHLTSYGYDNDTAPFINETFAKGGTVFDHCVAAAATTPPSHMSMFTSVQPCVHGLKTGFEVLPAWLRTLAEQLRADGVDTGAVTEDGWLGVIHGFGRGFNSYVENTSPDIMAPQGQVDVTFGKAKEWLRRNADKRFFLFLHTFQVHDPYSPPPEYNRFFGVRNGVPVTADSPREVRDPVNYDREIRYTDDELRKLFAAIAAYGLGRNTIFILVSDHGEEFFEHGLWGHGADLHEEVSRVPLMVWGPGRVAAGRRVQQPVGHIDFMPTILDLAGVAKPAHVQGVSFTDQLRDGSPDVAGTERAFFCEAWAETAVGPGYELVEFERPAYLVQIGNRKLARYRRHDGFEYKYYDLANDPAERSNGNGATAAPADMREMLDTYDTNCAAAALSLAQQGQTQGATTPEAVRLSPAEEEKLRALGYIK